MNNIVGVVAVTNKLYCIPNIINNYKRQNYEHKKLFIILNNDKFNISNIIKQCNELNISNFNVTQICEYKNLGYCLNKAILLLKQTNCEYFTKFDDDDYYGSNYISEMVSAFKSTNANIVGKRSTIIYTPEINKFLIPKSLQHGVYNSTYISICGSTISFRLDYLNKTNIKFNENLICGTDSKFIQDIHKHNGIIHSTSINNYIWVRHINSKYHTWKIDFDFFKKRFNEIKNDTIYKKMLEHHIFQ